MSVSRMRGHATMWRNHLQQVNVIRFTLPFLLFAVVLSYEVWEHWLLEGMLDFDIHLTSEVLFFGILGPTAVFLALTYIISLLKQQTAFAEQLKHLNQNLEHIVAERTEALAQRNAELAQANAELQKLDELKSDFVSLVSHELRAPLTTLNGGLEVVLQDTADLPPKSRRILEVMARESERLTGLVKTILDVSQLEAGKLKLNPGPVAVLPLLKRIEESFLANADRPVIWHTQADLPPLWADEMYLEEIVCNLLANANKYSPSDMPIEIAADMEDDCIKISIVDHGPGIPDELQSRIFDRFYRHQNGERINGGGWGLGLYLARTLTEAQGGYLTVQSPIHETAVAPGTRFTITLPITGEVPDDE